MYITIVLYICLRFPTDLQYSCTLIIFIRVLITRQRAFINFRQKTRPRGGFHYKPREWRACGVVWKRGDKIHACPGNPLNGFSPRFFSIGCPKASNSLKVTNICTKNVYSFLRGTAFQEQCVEGTNVSNYISRFQCRNSKSRTGWNLPSDLCAPSREKCRRRLLYFISPKTHICRAKRVQLAHNRLACAQMMT